MSIKQIWNKLFGKKQKEVLVPVEPADIIATPPPRKVSKEETELINCFYGTLVDREPGGVRTYRKRHLHDGWRSGKSHPFTFKGKVYDVQYNIDASVELFEKLMARIVQGG